MEYADFLREHIAHLDKRIAKIRRVVTPRDPKHDTEMMHLSCDLAFAQLGYMTEPSGTSLMLIPILDAEECEAVLDNAATLVNGWEVLRAKLAATVYDR